MASTTASPPPKLTSKMSKASLTLADAHESAKLKLTDSLKHPDDLVSKMGPLRQKLMVERLSVEAQLKTAVQGELNDSQEGMFLLQRTKKELGVVLEGLGKVEKSCEQAKDMIGNYTRIKKVRHKPDSVLLFKKKDISILKKVGFINKLLIC